MNTRTDLALEAHEYAKKEKDKVDGISFFEKKQNYLNASFLEVLNELGEKSIGMPMGKYVSMDLGRIWDDETAIFKKKVLEASLVLKELLNETTKRSSALICGLGNKNITADSIGPLAAESILVTRHIKKYKPHVFKELNLCDVCAVAPGVLGQTGIESADIVKSVVKKIKPSFVIAVDSLAARKLTSLATTLQFSTNGLSPGSGVGNNRMQIDCKSIGVPVISVGVPTVVDVKTLVFDVISDPEICKSGSDIFIEKEKLFKNKNYDLFVTPKESDLIMKSLSSFIGYCINLSLNDSLEYEEMLSLVG